MWNGHIALTSGSRNESVSAELTRRKRVHIAPHPGLTRFDGPHQRMLRLMKVLGGMAILGGVAARHMPTLEAKAEMDPCIPSLYAVLTHVFVGIRDLDLP